MFNIILTPLEDMLETEHPGTDALKAALLEISLRVKVFRAGLEEKGLTKDYLNEHQTLLLSLIEFKEKKGSPLMLKDFRSLYKHVSFGTVSNTANSLFKGGYIEKRGALTKDGGTTRGFALFLTEKGRNKLAEIHENQLKLYGVMIDGFRFASVEELQTMIRLFKNLINHFDTTLDGDIARLLQASEG